MQFTLFTHPCLAVHTLLLTSWALTPLSATWAAENQDREASAQVERHTQQYPKWSRIELTFAGPESQGRGMPNPFAVVLDAVFTGPTGVAYRVPGFYDGDGNGGLDGNLWRVRFSADRVGTWTYRTESSHPRLNDKNGRLTVTDVSDGAEGFWRRGRLEYTGTTQNGIRYLKFRDGPYWLKAGCDDPENFLGGYSNFDNLAKRKAAIDYLAQHKVNSLYIMTHNIDGDDRDVWPWLGTETRSTKSHAGAQARFDINKLERWGDLFEHMQRAGVVPYLVLEDDSAWKGFDRPRYYREIIARFGYLPALIINLAEEHNENYRLTEALGHMRLFREMDPYDHPLGIHNVNRPSDEYIDAPYIDFTSIQTGQPGTRKGVKHAVEHNQITVDWIQRCQQRGRRVLMVGFDEGRPEHDRRAWWSAYLGGGVWEAHVVEPYDRPFSAWEATWTQLGGTRTFMESLPFWEMQPRNDLIRAGMAFCLAKPGSTYALYLPEGGTVEVELPANASYTCDWWNPANGSNGRFQGARNVTGGAQSFTAPGTGDWALRIRASTVTPGQPG